jgi:hypothetical protein
MSSVLLVFLLTGSQKKVFLLTVVFLLSKQAEKGTPTISGKSKIKSKGKVKKHKKHKEKDRDKEKEQKKHKHRHKDRIKDKDKDKDKEKKKEKSGNHDIGGDHSKKHEKVTSIYLICFRY